MEKIDLIMKKTKASYNKSLFFLLFVIFISAWLFAGNKYLSSQNTEILNQITDIEGKIATLESDESVQVYTLLNANKKAIEKLNNRSKMAFFIDELDKLSSRYSLIIQGFQYASGKLSVQVYVRSDEFWLAYKKLKNFIEKYRKDQAAIYELDFIDNVSGSDNMKLNMNFHVK